MSWILIFSPKYYDLICKIIRVKFHEPTKFTTNTNLKLLIALRIIYDIYFASTVAQADLTILFIKIVMIVKTELILKKYTF